MSKKVSLVQSLLSWVKVGISTLTILSIEFFQFYYFLVNQRGYIGLHASDHNYCFIALFQDKKLNFKQDGKNV